jgi:Na+/glutamate symporter
VGVRRKKNNNNKKYKKKQKTNKRREDTHSHTEQKTEIEIKRNRVAPSFDFVLLCIVCLALFDLILAGKDRAPPFLLVCWLVCLLVLCVLKKNKYWGLSRFSSPFFSSLFFFSAV